MRFVTSPLVVAVALGLISRAALEEEDELPTEDWAMEHTQDEASEMFDTSWPQGT